MTLSVDLANCTHQIVSPAIRNTWPRGYKTCSKLNSAKHEINPAPAHKC